MRSATRGLLACLPLLAMTGCGLFGSDTKQAGNPPAALTDYPQTLQVSAAWSADSGGGLRGLSLGLAIAISGEAAFIADAAGEVTAVAIEDGKRRWRTATKLPVSGGPGAGEGIVVVGTSDAQLLALAADDGHELWRTRVSSEVLAPPQVAAGIVVVKTVDGRLAAHDRASGQRLWFYDSTVPVLSLRGSSAPVIDGDAVLAGFANGRVSALAVKDGRLLWENPVALPRGRSELERMVDIDGEPLLLGSAVYASTYQGRIASMSRLTGTVLWSREMSTYRGIGGSAGKIFVADATGTIWALDSASGTAYWRQEALQRRVTTAPVVVDGTVVVGDFEGYLHFMDTEDGHLLARHKVGSARITAPLKVIGGSLYALDADGKLTATRVGARS